MFDISGSPHINGRGKNPECGEGPGQIDWAPAVRAQLVALDEWVRGKAPPASRLFDLEARLGDSEVFQAPRYFAGAVVMVPKRDRDGINEYLTKIRLATRALVSDRLLLEEDAAVIVDAAAENPAFAPTRPRARRHDRTLSAVAGAVQKQVAKLSV